MATRKRKPTTEPKATTTRTAKKATKRTAKKATKRRRTSAPKNGSGGSILQHLGLPHLEH